MSFTAYLARQGYAPSTQSKYQKRLEQIWEMIGHQAPSREEFLAYLEGLAESHSLNYRREVLRVLRHYGQYQGSQGVDWCDPSWGLRLPSPQARFDYPFLSQKDLEGLFGQYQQAHPQALQRQAMLSLYIYQGLASGDLATLFAQHLDFAAGQLHLPGTARIRPRSLSLVAEQVLTLHQWSRQAGSKAPLFGQGRSLIEQVRHLMQQLRQLPQEVKNARQLRGSRIVLWLGQSNLRQVQYQAGHARISSTERFQVAQLADLQSEIDQFHPLT